MRRPLQQLVLIVAALLGPLALAAPQDDLLYGEALKADQRMYDNYRAFAKAVRAALGAEPKLSALEVSENTGGALVRMDDGRTRSFSFVEGKLSEPAASPLRDEAPRDEALGKRFTFDAIDLDKVRAVLKAQRVKPGHSADTAPELSAGYRAIVRELSPSAMPRWMRTIAASKPNARRSRTNRSAWPGSTCSDWEPRR